MEDGLTPPKPTIGDDAHRFSKIIASVALPAGGELLQAVIAPPLTKRQQDWQERVAEAICMLRDNHAIDIENLRDDPNFIDAVMFASRAAAYTSSEEKRQALQNAIMNAGLRREPDADERLVFIRLVDELTAWHIRILAFFNDPPAWFRAHDAVQYNPAGSSSLSAALEKAYPDLVGRRDLYDQIGRELKADGLLTIEGFHGMMSTSGWQSSRTTARGKALLAFITSPNPE